MTKNLIIYSRISLADKDPVTGERDESKVIAQERACRAWIEREGYGLADVVRENSRSAYKEWSRPKFNALLDRAKAGEVEGIVSFAEDRLTRHPKEMEALIDLAEDHDVLVRTLDGLLDLTTDTGRHYARGGAARARYEVERKSKRHKDGNALRLEQGRPPQGGGRPFGFEADKIAVRRSEAAVIRWACKRVKSGTSIRTLTREWNDAGLRTTRGSEWTRHGVRQVLRRWRNAGIREHDGEPVGQAVWPAIVDRDVLEAVRERLQAKPDRPVIQTRKHLLSGIALCAKCGHPVQADSTLSGGRRYFSYRCRGGAIQARCGLAVRQDVVDEAVLDAAARLLASRPPGLVNVAGVRQAAALRSERQTILEQTKAMVAANFSKEFETILTRAASFDQRVRMINAQLQALADNDALASLLGDLSPLTRVHIERWEHPRGNRETVRARLDAIRIEDLGRLRRILAALVTVQLLPWTATGKPTAETARRRVAVAPRDAYPD